VIPGSHRDGLRQHDEGHHGDNMLQRGEEIQVEVDESQAHDLVLQPGEMSLHESNIIHGSGQNRSDLKRIGFIVRYVTPAEFTDLKNFGMELGFAHVEAGPLVRSSYHADDSHASAVN